MARVGEGFAAFARGHCEELESGCSLLSVRRGAVYDRHPRLTAFKVPKFPSEADCARSNGIVFSFLEVGLQVGLVSQCSSVCTVCRFARSGVIELRFFFVQITPLLPFFRRADSTSVHVASVGVTSIQYSILGSDTSNGRHRIPPRASVTWRKFFD